MFAVALAGYFFFKLNWIVLVALFLAPDLSMLAYLAGPRIGAILYNLAHTYAFALAVLGLGIGLDKRSLFEIGLIWCAHIGFDRALGFGLKSAEGFRFTHLGHIGHEE